MMPPRPGETHGPYPPYMLPPAFQHPAAPPPPRTMPPPDKLGQASVSSLSKEAAVTKIAQYIKEFFVIRLLDKAESYFGQLPAEHRFRLVKKLTWVAIRSKVTDALLVADLFTRARAKNLCSPSCFEEGFRPIAELLDDIAVDASNAYDLFSVLMKSAGLDKDEERRAQIVMKLMDSDRLVMLL